MLPAGLRWLKASRLRPTALYASQSNESVLIESIATTLSVPKSFCEFGFDVMEFNCGRLVRPGWRGLLIDGNMQRVRVARRVLAKDPTIDVIAECVFLDLTNLYPLVRDFARTQLGVLSIDVDGNDYWFLEALLPLKPVVIVVEYNASMGLRPITVPYDPRFDRTEKHPSGWYHGASLTAMSSLSEQHGYALIAVSDGGWNAFFCRRDWLAGGFVAQHASDIYRECALRNTWSGTVASQQWDTIKRLPYVQV